MRLWRVSRYPSIDGEGGLYDAGRWHSIGRRITHCSLHPATALLEWIVHLELDLAKPPKYIPFIIIEAGRNVPVERVADLPDQWRESPEITQSIGDAWLTSKRTAILVVPSAVVREADNALLNPAHRDFRHIAVVERQNDRFDSRLFRGDQ